MVLFKHQLAESIELIAFEKQRRGFLKKSCFKQLYNSFLLLIGYSPNRVDMRLHESAYHRIYIRCF